MKNSWTKVNVLKLSVLMLFSLIASSTALAQLYPVSLDQRVANSKVIFEGKVISSKSYWDEKHFNIYTANVVEVYKVFKGNLTASTVELITLGGTVGSERETVTHTLELENGYVGVFMVYPETIKPAQNPNLKSYRAYADSQGFVKYNLIDKSAADPFTTYESFSYLYSEITKRTKTQYKELKKLDFK